MANSDKELFLHEDGKNGFILDNGDLQSVFSTNNQGKRSVWLAIAKGAVTLDCFDGFLPDWYPHFGFEEYKREPNWTPGEADVVFMRLRKDEDG